MKNISRVILYFFATLGLIFTVLLIKNNYRHRASYGIQGVWNSYPSELNNKWEVQTDFKIKPRYLFIDGFYLLGWAKGTGEVRFISHTASTYAEIKYRSLIEWPWNPISVSNQHIEKNIQVKCNPCNGNIIFSAKDIQAQIWVRDVYAFVKMKSETNGKCGEIFAEVTIDYQASIW